MRWKISHLLFHRIWKILFVIFFEEKRAGKIRKPTFRVTTYNFRRVIFNLRKIKRFNSGFACTEKTILIISLLTNTQPKKTLRVWTETIWIVVPALKSFLKPLKIENRTASNIWPSLIKSKLVNHMPINSLLKGFIFKTKIKLPKLLLLNKSMYM